ncbi:thiamine pyrophosphate-dependent enzyme [Halosegnis marinus]|uniref:Thiamine pyrophosphate-dependent enzyme n=1 Tax=Halosegnis marinus TaxID=3034023 RepID=A0ABD5ZL35_9EURY|nr:thiamine pyrophosphate-dependent enzyme [Halosegnis sp. DT85]
MHRVIGERSLSETPFDGATARALFEGMVRARAFDERALALQRRGWMSGYPPFRGGEATQVAAAHAMRDDDWLFPTYRSNAMQIARGVPMADILRFRRGHDEYGSDHDVPNFPQAVPIATQIPHAAGAAMAMQRDDGDRAAVAYFGDGATSEGDFHEGLNFAGVFDAPCLFLCENNGWAISLPREKQTRAASIAAKADAYGFEGVQVDGMDPLAVLETVGGALDSVRAGDPVLVEALTYRLGPHTTSDDPSRYEERADYPEWRTRDPLDRFEEYLVAERVVDGATRSELEADAKRELDAAVAAAEDTPEPDLDEVFDHVYAETPPRLETQRAWLRDHAERHGIEGVER